MAGETPQACRGGSRPPAESECLEWKSTFPFYKRNLLTKGFYLNKNKVDWKGRYENPAGKTFPGETPQACRGGSRPPAESECLEWKSTFHITNHKKAVGKQLLASL
ncbi:hypothetical protein GCM10009597_04590 [Peribacillus frigoritolerans]